MAGGSVMLKANDKRVKDICEEVWGMNAFKLFRTLHDRKLISDGTVSATDMFDDDFLFDFRAQLVVSLFNERFPQEAIV